MCNNISLSIKSRISTAASMKIIQLFLILLLQVTAIRGALESIPQVAVYGLAGNGTIFYQDVGALGTLIEFLNILNPITVTISYEQNVYNYEATVCLNYYEFYYPISGVNLAVSCPAGAIGQVSNMTSFLDPQITSSHSLKYYKSKSTVFMQQQTSKHANLPPGTTVDTISAQMYIKPSNKGGFIVTIPDSIDPVAFVISYSGLQCKEAGKYPYDGQSCQSIDELTFGNSVTFPLGSGSWQYYQIELDHTNNLVNVSFNANSEVEFYIQSGYYPTRDWYLPQTIISNHQNENEIISLIFTPGSINSNEKFFFGIYNSNKDSQTVVIGVTYESCPTNRFGYQCAHDITISDNPITGFYALDGCLPDSDPNTSNNGTSLSFPFTNDNSDSNESYSEYDYAYFSLSSYPKNYSPLPYYIRVTVASNDVSKTAPNFFAKKGGAASAQSNHYNSSTSAVSHQILIRINQEDLNQQYNGLTILDTWFFAVQLPADFSIWVAVNCADNCNENEHGSCYCGNVTCDSLTNNGTTNFQSFYERPIYLSDSAGSCICDNPEYNYSPTCSAKNNGHNVLYLSIVTILFLVVILIALLIPAVRYLIRKRKAQYEQSYHPIN